MRRRPLGAVAAAALLTAALAGLPAPIRAQAPAPNSAPTGAQPTPEGPPLPGAPVRVGDLELSVALSPRTPTVGDRVTALFTLTAPAAAVTGEPRFPDWQGAWGAAEVVSFTEPERLTERDGIATWRQRVELTAFRPGTVALPPVEVTVPTRTEGDLALPSPAGLGFAIASVLPDPTDPDSPLGAEGEEGEEARSALEPRPPEAPRTLPWGRLFWILAGVLAAVTAGLLWWLWKSRRPAPASAPDLGPLEELEVALAACATRATPVAAHAQLSTALRRYLGRRLGFSALESTTTEIRRRLHRAVLPAGGVEGVLTVLTACDGVKFDRRDPARSGVAPTGDASLGGRIDLARRSAQTLERHLRPPDPQGGEGDAPAPPPNGGSPLTTRSSSAPPLRPETAS